MRKKKAIKDLSTKKLEKELDKARRLVKYWDKLMAKRTRWLEDATAYKTNHQKRITNIDEELKHRSERNHRVL